MATQKNGTPNAGKAQERIMGSTDPSRESLESLRHEKAAHRAVSQGLLNPFRSEVSGDALTELVEIADYGRPAFRGIAGNFVRDVLPHTEADPAALLTQFLTVTGNMIGEGPYRRVGGDRHPAKLYVLVVGMTSTARKGTSYSEVKRVFDRAFPGWREEHEQTGLSSDEGLADALAAATGNRVLVTAEEFASLLRRADRAGSTLSTGLRNLWDRNQYQILRHKDPISAEGFLSVISHVTRSELSSEMDLGTVSRQNGFANRFLYCVASRSKDLPHGGHLGDEDLDGLARLLKQKVERARRLTGDVEFTRRGSALWDRVYRLINELIEHDHPEYAALLARAQPYVLRVALIYSMLDDEQVIKRVHVRAALGVWLYSFFSVQSIFGEIDKTHDDDVLDMLASHGEVTRSQITKRLQSRGLNAQGVHRLLDGLEERGMVERGTRPSEGPGRPAEVVRLKTQ